MNATRVVTAADRTQMLRIRQEEKLSAKKIAARLGFTHNQVAGVLFRAAQPAYHKQYNLVPRGRALTANLRRFAKDYGFAELAKWVEPQMLALAPRQEGGQ